MLTQLTEIEARVVGVLVEKQLTTPEYYPMTLNALVNGCNQKTNRDPIVAYTEQIVTSTLENLREKNLVYVFYGSTSRVPKYKHMLPEVYDLEPPETALVSVLMLRGAQTLGELRERASRLYEFSGLGEAAETLDNLAARDEPLVIKLERLAGQKEVRYAHLLSGEVTQIAPAERAFSVHTKDERIGKLEETVESLTAQVAEIRQMFEDFKRQFE